jgi:hypothetical protein
MGKLHMNWHFSSGIILKALTLPKAVVVLLNAHGAVSKHSPVNTVCSLHTAHSPVHSFTYWKIINLFVQCIKNYKEL